jgi:hypothetical protein
MNCPVIGLCDDNDSIFTSGDRTNERQVVAMPIDHEVSFDGKSRHVRLREQLLSREGDDAQ